MHSEPKKIGGAIIRAGAIIGMNTVLGAYVHICYKCKVSILKRMVSTGVQRS